MAAYRSVTIPVEGGELCSGVWGESGPVLLCSHGITGNHRSFLPLVDALDNGVRIVAPDHRGRGGSRGITGPWGMEAHAADIVALLDHLEIQRADVLLGHSMGAFIAAVTNAQYGDRIGATLMVDGGLPLMDEIPAGLTTEQLINAVIGPAMQRLDMNFESRDAYRDFWRQHPAFADDWSHYVESYVDYDLVGEPPMLRSSVVKDAILGDTESQLVSDLVPGALRRMQGPVRLLRAPRGLMNDAPLYTEERVAQLGTQIEGFSFATVDDVNHYTIVMSAAGAAAIAAEVKVLLG